MTTSVEGRAPAPVVAELIALLDRTTDPREIEMVADQLGAADNPHAIRPLLMRLGDCHVQEDADVEDAVCRALVALDVMRSSGNLSFALRPRHLLAADVVEAVRELGPAIPMRYLLARGIEGTCSPS
jgi:hypothetical protein